MNMSNRQSALEQRIRSVEESYRVFLPKGAPYAILRVDGRSFSTYTRGLDAPVDEKFMSDMDAAAQALCAEIAGARGAYVVSDEISVVMASDVNGNFFFDGAVVKIASVCAGIASAVLSTRRPEQGFAAFDGRVAPADSFAYVMDYLRWRQGDGQRNAISMAAESLFSHRELMSMKTSERLAGMASKGYDYDALPEGFRKGRFIVREQFAETVTYTNQRTKVAHTVEAIRSRWTVKPAPSFRDLEVDADTLFNRTDQVSRSSK